MKKLILFLAFVTVAAQAQTPRSPFVRASGEGVVSAKPDQVRLTVGVTTQGATAAEAAQKNAEASAKVQAELKALLGPSASLKTSGFNLSPEYRSNNANPKPVIAGYTATNSVEATSNDISLAGKMIDAGVKAGANNIHGIQFSLKDSTAARTQALKLATQQARAQAEAIAQGLGGRAGRVLSATDSVAGSSPQPIMPMARMAMAATPVESGDLEIRATVTIEVEFLTGN